MNIDRPFWNGHDRRIEDNKWFVGVNDQLLKGKKYCIHGITEEEILEIRQMLLDEVKRQNESQEM